MKKILSKRLKMIDSQGMKSRKENERFCIADDIATFTCFFLQEKPNQAIKPTKTSKDKTPTDFIIIYKNYIRYIIIRYNNSPFLPGFAINSDGTVMPRRLLGAGKALDIYRHSQNIEDMSSISSCL